MTPPEVVERQVRNSFTGQLETRRVPVLTCCEFQREIERVDTFERGYGTFSHHHHVDDVEWGFDSNGEVWVVEEYLFRRRTLFTLRNAESKNCEECDRGWQIYRQSRRVCH